MKYAALFLFALCTTFPYLLSAQTNFTRTLSLGMSGEDVRQLQIILNSDSETLVSESGPGSKGNETLYFGNATKRALIRFQEKYASEILTPIGLTEGTGVFGVKTREKMNKVGVSAPVVAADTEKQSISVAPKVELKKEVTEKPIEKGEVTVMYASPVSAKVGTMITIFGMGFTAKDNTVFFGEENEVINAVSKDGQSIVLKVPPVKKGVYRIFVRNARGESDKEAGFIVVDGVTPVPKIEKVEPARVKRGDTVIVKGTGFVRENNIVNYSAGIYRNISSENGTLLSFVIPKDLMTGPLPDLSAYLNKEISVTQADDSSLEGYVKPKVWELPIAIVVANENGISEQVNIVLEF